MTTTIQDNWRDPAHTEKHQGMGTTLKTRTGTTIFIEGTQYPHIPVDDCVDAARTPKAAGAPQEFTQQERELHELTHAPISQVVRCVCVKSKGRANYHKQRYDCRPVIQVDYFS
eukprot:2723655-Lingulodinium_polyedra.AAC.1